MNKNKVHLSICGIECSVNSEDPESYVLSVANEVQKMIAGMTAKNDRVSVATAAVIAAMSFCDEARKAKDSADNLRSQIRDYLEDSSKSRMEADESRREIERLRREIQTLRGRLSGEEESSASPARPAQAPVQQARPAQTHSSHTGSYSKPAVSGPSLEEQQGFMSFFEKKPEE